jgi:uncharacterized protein
MARKVTDDKWNALFDFFFYYGSYLWFPAVVILGTLYYQGVIGSLVLGLCLLAIAISFYGRFIEPRRLVVKEQQIDLTPEDYDGETFTFRAALFSDTHYGIFRNALPLAKIRQKVDESNVDLVLVAGDLTNHLMVHEIDQAFSEFENFKAPVFAVLGNHDFGRPGWMVSDFLAKRLESFGVILMENKRVDVEVKGATITLAGLVDHYTADPDHRVLEEGEGAVPHLVLTHNPDTVLGLPEGITMGLMVCGHTHGGQIRLPRLYKKAIPTRHAFDAGYYETGGHKVFVSSGTGMDVLPVRLFIPPRLDILNIRISKS